MTSTPPIAYQPFYCEENIWHLAQRIDLIGAGDHEVVFVIGARPGARVACWYQRAAPPHEAILWDYHVVLAETRGDEVAIWDLDTRLPLPCPAALWLGATFQDARRVPTRFHPRFRLVPRDRFVRELATDRSHMRAPDGTWFHPPPPWDPPGAPGMTLPCWWDARGGPGVLLDRAALELRWRLV